MPDIFVSDQKKPDIDVPIISDSPKTIDAPLEEDDSEKFKHSNRPHIFSSFCRNPEGISFQNQEDNEKILLFIRKSKKLSGFSAALIRFPIAGEGISPFS